MNENRDSNWFQYFFHFAGTTHYIFKNLTGLLSWATLGLLNAMESCSRRRRTIEQSVGTVKLYWTARIGNTNVVEIPLQTNVDHDRGIIDGYKTTNVAVKIDQLSLMTRLLEDDKLTSEDNIGQLGYSKWLHTVVYRCCKWSHGDCSKSFTAA